MQSLELLFRKMDGLDSKLDAIIDGLNIGSQKAKERREFNENFRQQLINTDTERFHTVSTHLANQAALLKEIAESQGKLLAAIDALNEEARLRGASSAGHLCGVEARLKASIEKWPDTPQTELCMAKNKEGFTCNEDKGHIGWHVAHDLTHAVEAWRDSPKRR